MVRTLILVRHGRPEAPSAGVADASRELTPAGAAALDAPAGFPRTFSLLGEGERAGAAIWSSTAARALQTARAASRALGGAPVEEHPSLWEQDNAGFLAELKAADAPLVVAVGHIPFMNEMAAWLTGVPLAFKPGGAAAIELGPSLDGGSGKLLWFVQGPEA